VVLLWALSGVGSAYQLAANAAFVAAVPPEGRGQAFGLAQSGILAGQGLGILLAGAAAQVLGPETVVALAGVLGLSVAAMLTLTWNQVRGEVIADMHERPEAEDVPEPESARDSTPEDVLVASAETVEQKAAPARLNGHAVVNGHGPMNGKSATVRPAAPAS
jgi:MFS family permease